MGLGKELGFSVCLRVRGCSIKGSRDYSIDYSGGRRGGLLLISVAPDTLSLSLTMDPESGCGWLERGSYVDWTCASEVEENST